MSASARATLAQQKRAIRQEYNASRKEHNRAMKEMRLSPEEQAKKEERRSEARLKNSYHHAAVELARLVASSFDIKPVIRVELTDSMSGDYRHALTHAQTDFRSIYVTVPFVPADPRTGMHDEEKMREWITTLSGLMYHELGHIIFSVPPGAMPFQAAGLEVKDYHGAWNLLEDQRMETAMAATSPVMGRYFTSMLLDLEKFAFTRAEGYPYLAGRWYLPADLIAPVRDLFVGRFGEEVTQKVDDLVARYNSATSVNDLMTAIIDWEKLKDAYSIPDEVSGHSSHTVNPPEGHGIPNKEQRVQKGATSREDVEPPSKDEELRTSGGNSSGGVDGTHEEETQVPKPPSPWEAMDKAREDLKKDEKFQNRVTQHTDEFLDSVNATSKSSLLTAMDSTEPLEGETLDAGNLLRSTISKALEAAVAPNAPRWAKRTNEGILSPFEYRTRQRGDRSFYRQRVGEGNDLYDIAVSLVLDRSGSMCGEVHELSAMAYGVKAACYEMGIPCTVSSFGSHSFLEVDAEEPPRMTEIGISGLTDPTDAIKALPEQDMGKRWHLIMLMTDGGWTEDMPPVLGLNDLHRIKIGFLFDRWVSEVPEDKQAMFQRAGFEEVHAIKDLNEIATLTMNNLLNKVR